ncbi:MAG: molybdopterin-guanine dinucleotide biosynthesis protein B [Nitrospiraceae bacterium]|nr:molybdopterin-guanine dinucleotide biosynthesis protein B [Nitrospiraceae bacterium]
MKTVSFIAAKSGSGKTTLIEKIVPLLKARGLRVAVIKHASKGFDLDRQGKDSWRFREAGADTVLLVGPGGLALQQRLDSRPALADLERMAGNADVIITEGFKAEAKNRIEVFREGVSGERPLASSDASILAIASDRRFDLGIPWLDLNDAAGVAAFIASKLQL